ncbi:MAG: site-2 protease family protein [Parachlamydiaceae bacterium]
MLTFAYVIGAILALSFLIFIHEFGHYWMARREGMRVEVFSIGFGRPIISWTWSNVKWQIGWLLFGGYVRIAGTDTESDVDLTKVKDGFFGKSPWSRIKVAFMGPFVNILFALLAFTLLFAVGGRLKPFSEYTTKAGWVDPASELYVAGVRPGDEVLYYNGTAYNGVNDLVYLGLTSTGPVKIQGEKIDDSTGKRTPFEVEATAYLHPEKGDRGLKTLGVLEPASFLIYDRLPSGAENPLPEHSPMQGSGLQYGDRLLWVDGSRIYSTTQLGRLLAEAKAVLTISRNGKTLLVRVPRVQVSELKFDSAFREELTDWQHAEDLGQIRFTQLITLPYNLTNEAVVENSVPFIDKDKEEAVYPKTPLSTMDEPLIPGDKILAVDGTPIKSASQLLKLIQNHSALVIVERLDQKIPLVSWKDADHMFDLQSHPKELEEIVNKIGVTENLSKVGPLVLLKPVQPKTFEEIFLPAEGITPIGEQLLKQKRAIIAIEDKALRERLLEAFSQKERQIALGIPNLRDVKVEYNPVPTDQFMNVFGEIKRTLVSLFTGSLSPKWLSGPVGIVYMFQEQTKSSLGDGLYWLGLISLNLGVLNLLPIPMLDGGTIFISFIELVTGKRIAPKTLEKLVLPFAIVLILFFLFWTYNDVTRIFGGFFR